MIKVSLIASSIRPHLYEDMFKSLEGTTVEYEVVFGGPLKIEDISQHLVSQHCDNDDEGEEHNVTDWEKQINFIDTHWAIGKSNFKYIRTENIKPAQIYEVCRRHATGETLIWVADDCEFPNDVIGKVYRFYKEKCSRKDVVCIQTRENYGKWQVCDIEQHKFFAASANAPKMAPIGMINREYFQELGGIDRRYVSGQWDNDLLIRVYNDGGKLYHFSEATVDIDHLNKHDPKYGISAERPFGQFYVHDRRILEGSWGRRGQMKYDVLPYQRYDDGFEPYTFDDNKIMTESESYKGMWE